MRRETSTDVLGLLFALVLALLFAVPLLLAYF